MSRILLLSSRLEIELTILLFHSVSRSSCNDLLVDSLIINGGRVALGSLVNGGALIEVGESTAPWSLLDREKPATDDFSLRVLQEEPRNVTR